MRKLFIIFFIFCFAQANCFGAFFFFFYPKVDTSQGYVGKLPDLTTEHKPSEPNVSPPIFDKAYDFNSADKIKPTPTDDPVFVNIILKKDKTSEFYNDVQEFIDMLEKISDSIESHEDVQRFASRVYYLNVNADYLCEKYENKPESSYSAFKQIVKISNNAKEVSKLRSDAEKYKKYLAYTDTGAEYSKNNIEMELFNLKNAIERTISILKNVQ